MCIRDRQYTGLSEIGIYATPDDKFGYIRFDDEGSGPYEAPERMFIATEKGKALKIQSGANLSITAGESGGVIYLGSSVVFKTPPNFVLA